MGKVAVRVVGVLGRMMIDVGRPERADAARNRRKILDAAARVLAGQGTTFSVEVVARAAGVGVGTVYRRFGDLTGLAFALLDHRLGEFDEAVRSGPLPLGPGAPPDQRVRAFLHGLAELVLSELDLVLLAEAGSPAARYASGRYQGYRRHLVSLLEELGPELDANYLADALLALVSSTLLNYQCREREIGLRRVKAGMDQLLTCCLLGEASR